MGFMNPSLSASLHAELTYGSVSKWCITKADIWLSQIGPDTQSRQLGASLDRKKLPDGTFLFILKVAYISYKGHHQKKLRDYLGIFLNIGVGGGVGVFPIPKTFVIS